MQRKPLNFMISDRIFLKVSPTWGLSNLADMGSLVLKTIGLSISSREWELWHIDLHSPNIGEHPQCFPCLSIEEIF